MEIVPAILATNVKEFDEKISKVSSFATKVHVDFNDGSFQRLETVKPENLNVLPLDVLFEAHLMVQKPFDYIPKLKELGFKKFIVQWETEDNIRDVLEQLMGEEVLVGVAVAPETPISDLEPILEMVDSIVVMTVEPGKQGQEFLAENLKKVQELRDGNFFGEVEVDGGINEESIQKILPFRPDMLIVGSCIVKSENPIVAYERLAQLV